MSPIQTKRLLLQSWRAGVNAVHGTKATANALRADNHPPITNLLAIGKAAEAMTAAAREFLHPNARVLLVTKYGHLNGNAADERIKIMQAGHPLPDENSLQAGRAAVDFIRALPPDERLIMLLSGGASALLEVLTDGMDLPKLQSVNEAMLSGGFNIAEINAVRARLSQIKGGRLLRECKSAVRVYAISDVPGDDIGIIGGGIGGLQWPAMPTRELPKAVREVLAQVQNQENATAAPPDYHARIIASNRIARNAAAEHFRAQGIAVVTNQESLHQDVHSAAKEIGAALLRGGGGGYVWGGEPSVILPPKPGIGGRCQSLALGVAEVIRGRRDISLLAAGSDGGDGPGDAAGAMVDGDTWGAAAFAARRALDGANAGSYLARQRALFKSGPTGTNVMDLVVGIVG